MRGEEGLLWWRVLDKVDALLNVLLQFLIAALEELLLVRADVAKDIGSLLRTRGLRTISFESHFRERGKHTPNSTGTEKKSTPVSFAIASPPSTPGR